LSITGNLSLNGGATNAVEISSVTNDTVNVSGNLSLSGVNTINLTLLSVLPAGTYQLIKYSGTLASGSVANLTLAGYPVFRTSASLVHNAGTKSIDLVLTGSPASLVWQGGLNGNAWDVVLTTNWLNLATPDVFFNGDGVTFNNVGAANSTVNLVGSLLPTTATVNSITDYTFSGAGKLSGLSSLVKDGINKLTVLTTNDNSGTVTITSGTLQVGNGTASGSLGTGNVTDNAALAFNVPGSLTVANQISGSGSLAVNAGTVVLTANNSYGATTIDNGTTLQAGNGGATGSIGAGAVTDNGALIYRRTGTVTNAGSISGSGSLTVQLGGTVVLAANNSYNGPTTVETGTLQVGAGGTAGSLGSAGTVTLTTGGRLAFNRSDVLTNAVTVLGTSGTLAQFGTGTLVITNDANDYGPTLITAGRLQLGDGINASGQLGRGTITVTSPGSLVFKRPDVHTLTNLVAGNGALAHVGPTNLVVTTSGGANTFSGGTTISNTSVRFVAPVTTPVANGAQQVNGSGLGTGAVTFQGNSSLQLHWADQTDPDGAGAGNFANAIVVPAGQTATIYTPGRFEFSAAVSGAGTINYGANYVRGNVSGNWTNYTGQLNVIANPVNTNPVAHDFRVFNTIGFPNAKVRLMDNSSLFWRGAANAVVPIGEFSGGDLSFFGGTGGQEGGNAVTWMIGRLNTDSTYDGTSAGSVAIGIRKIGTGKLTFTGANSYIGNTTVSNGVLALSTNLAGVNAELQTTPLITLAAPGALDVTGRTDATFNLGIAAAQTNAGNGSLLGNLVVHQTGTVAPGFSVGTLTVSGNLVFNLGTYLVELNLTNNPTSDRIVAQNVDLNGANILVNNIGKGVTNGAIFQIFQASGTISGTAATVTGGLPPGPGSGWNTNNLTANGTIIAMTPPAPALTNIVTGGNTLDFSWDPAYLGWRLYVQTNTLSVGLSNNWFAVEGSENVTTIQHGINSGVGTVFYRLSYP
jgi:autotransporter-associated beta strand protein